MYITSSATIMGTEEVLLVRMKEWPENWLLVSLGSD